MTTERPLSAAPDLDDLWTALWDDLRHNATGQPSGHAIIHRHRNAIEEAAARQALDELAALRADRDFQGAAFMRCAEERLSERVAASTELAALRSQLKVLAAAVVGMDSVLQEAGSMKPGDPDWEALQLARSIEP